ncbi:glycosyltransferase [Bacillus sp. REN16]|uniref:glycosyltransferase n=1 Tax=Bacillus sp. REN16 TaxID=2887296 RepID=UPI001E555448|nr:glycosyltransferase [Bacillus sp. REN16]MCC3356088.1 glycosyltransferase [Bacillus sp. REN16]
MPFFSIIVPVYNVDNYLRQCIDSIISQSFNDYELILVDDGSTDQSPAICDEYANNNNKIRVIHKLNGGLSDARNVGIKNATGEFIIFVDSDDYIISNTLNNFYLILKNDYYADVLITRIMKVFSENEIKYMDSEFPIDKFKNGNKEDVISWIFRKSQIAWPSVRYIVRRTFIKNNNLNFKKGYLHEDIDWTSKLFLYADKFTVSDYFWYSHRMERVGAITSNKSGKRVLDVIDIVQENINNPNYLHLDNNSRTIIFERLVLSIFYMLKSYKYLRKEEKLKIEEKLKGNLEIFKYTSSRKHKCFLYFCKFFGFKLGLNVLRLF